MNVRTSCLFILAFLFLASCDRGPAKNREVLARVNNTYLYLDEISEMIPSGISEADSLEIIRAYVNSWMHNQLIIQDAVKTLSTREKDFSDKIRDYRNALLIFQWEKKLFSEQLDTLVTDDQLGDYYNANSHEFILQADIVRVLYIRLNFNTPFRNEAVKLMSADPFSKSETEQFCRKYAVNYFLDYRSWLFVEDILKEIPLSSQQKQEMLTGNAFIEMKDDEYLYLLKVLDVNCVAQSRRLHLKRILSVKSSFRSESLKLLKIISCNYAQKLIQKCIFRHDN
jgi:hypothetical protein